MTTQSFDATRFPTRLNLGCGYDLREGFLNVDIRDWHNPDLIADITHLDMLPSGRYEEIIAQDVLEHLPRTSTVPVLQEWSRLLAVGGTLHLRVPSVIDLVELMKAPEHQSIEQQERLVQCLFGTQAYTEDTHYTTFTEPLLRHYLRCADLEVKDWGMRDEWLFEIDAVKVEGLAEEPAPAPRQSRLAHLVGRLAGKRSG